MKIQMKRLLSRIAARIAPVSWKEFHELSYWKKKAKVEGDLSNSHYKYFYTTHFGLEDSYYNNKFILDIGCGPRGSLEWASMASRCVGLDPLAREYLQLGARHHAMEYIDSPSERIPLRNAECDVVCSFNSLDHVQNVEQTLSEIKRVIRPNGLFLLLVEVNHPPTACEPHHLSQKKLEELLRPEFVCEALQFYKPVADGIYDSIRANVAMPLSERETGVGYLSARFRRTADGL